MATRLHRIVIYVTLAQFALLPIAGCGGRAANPVKSVQVGDSALSCEAIRTEMSTVESQVQALIPESKKTGKNVALATAGLFLIVPFFFMDSGAAEDAEIKAYRDRYGELQKMYVQKGCEAGSVGDVTPTGAKSKKDKLLELKDLYDQKLINDAEYAKAKEALLNAE
ncbi:MAG: SHOCT domain-containing protein [Desulfobulbus sp.]|nr:SHOCT domain-containing protein [Desulfobulbus sp.]